jgi:hypothetical protein
MPAPIFVLVPPGDPTESHETDSDWQFHQSLSGHSVEKTTDQVRVRHLGDHTNVTSGFIFVVDGQRVVLTSILNQWFLWLESDAIAEGWIE